MIEVKNVSKKFGTVTALDQVSLKLESGQIIGLLGPNGAGKTTLMRVLTGYLASSSGSVAINGLSPLENPLAIKKMFGYLPEGNPLYQEMTVAEYLHFAAALKIENHKDQTSAINRVTHSCGLIQVVGQKIDTLSKGFRQRVGLAQALLNEPPILILDEPTAGLDPNQVVEIRQLIQKIGQEKTVLLSTHILSEVQSTCNQVIIINQGRIVMAGSISELRSKGEQAFAVDFKIKGTADNIMAAFQTKEWVKEIKELTRDDQGVSYRLHPAHNEVVGEKVYAVIKAQDWVLLELSPETLSLEETFRELTQT